MLILQPDLKQTIGWITGIKLLILLLFVLWSIVSSRPFCRTTCPLGAFLCPFQPAPADPVAIQCRELLHNAGRARVCPMGINFNENSLQRRVHQLA